LFQNGRCKVSKVIAGKQKKPCQGASSFSPSLISLALFFLFGIVLHQAVGETLSWVLQSAMHESIAKNCQNMMMMMNLTKKMMQCWREKQQQIIVSQCEPTCNQQHDWMAPGKR